MENSMKKSKSTFNEISEDVKVFIKLSSREESSLDTRLFFFEENREVLLLQKRSENLLKYKYDYIFSDYENTLSISSSIKLTISNLVKNEKNLTFFSFGEEKLGKSKFFFGHSNKFTNDSFLKYTYDTIYSLLRKEFSFDNVLIDIFKISNEKFVIDYRNIPYDTKYDIIDFLNQISREGLRNSVSQSMQSGLGYENGHVLISLKFFKFVTDADLNKEQREVEIIRTVSFVDFEGFNSNFTEILRNKKNVSINNDAKNYTLVCLKNFLEAMSSVDLQKYSEINSSLCSVLVDILRTHNSSIFMFAFINQNEASLYESKVTLELMKKFKNLNSDYFFDVVHEMNIDISNMDENKYFKEEYHVAEVIFSEILCYVENFRKNHQSDKTKLNLVDNLYSNIKDLSQCDKYYYLKDWMSQMNFDFEYGIGIKIKKIFEDVFSFLNNRSKWNNLYRARDEIIKLNSNIKIDHNINTLKSCEMSVNDTYEWNSVLRGLNLVSKNIEEKENVSILDKSSDKNNNPYAIPNSHLKVSTLVHSPQKETTNIGSHISNLKKTTDTTSKSIESTFMGLILKEFTKNMNKSFKNIYEKFTQDEKCLSCQKSDYYPENVNFFNFNVAHYSLLKSGMYKGSKDKNAKYSDNSFRKDSFLDNNNLKSTNLKSINMTKPAEKIENITENKLISIADIEQDNIAESPIHKHQKNSHSECWSGILPSKIDSGYNSESIHIFKINKRENEKEAKIFIDQERGGNKSEINCQIEQNQEPIDMMQTVKNSNFNQNVNIYKDNSIFFHNNELNKTNLNQNIFHMNHLNTNSNNSSMYLDERISKIDQRMGNLQTRRKDTSIFENKIINFDSRILSVNDMSEMEDSKILKRKSFLSLNN